MPPIPRILVTRYLSARTSPTATRPFMTRGSRDPSTAMVSPWCRFVVLEEQAPEVMAGIHPVEHRIDDAGRAIDDIQRRVKAMNASFAHRVHLGILIGDPSGIHAVHVDSITYVIGRRGP